MLPIGPHCDAGVASALWHQARLHATSHQLESQDLAELERVAQQVIAPPQLGEVPDCCSSEVALDGKTICDTIRRGQNRGVHMLAACVPQQGVVLLQVAVEGKENEIVAAPLVLGQLDLSGLLITGDAIFTRWALSIQIVGHGSDYLWILKDNQPMLRDDIELLFEEECVSAGWSAPPVDFILVLGMCGRQGITSVAEAQRAIAYHLDRCLHHSRTAGAAQATT